MSKKCALLINLGTPDGPSVKDVRKYLREFLMDERVIDIPFLQRFLLVNGIIAPFRAPKSAEVYREVWTEEGSPLKVIGFKVQEILAKELGNDYHVAFAMRYQNPSIRDVLKELEKKAFKEIIVIPLYPQYASSTTGSTVEKVFKEINKWENIPQMRVINKFLEHPLFIKAFAEIGKEYKRKKKYDHFVFSFHGLPERHIKKAAQDNYCQINDKCCSVYHSKNQLCYRAQCFQTARLIAEEMQINLDDITVCFQSRLGKDPWIQPYIDDSIDELINKGNKKVLVFSPAFVADCLETTIEIGVEYKKIFVDKGGEDWDLVESLNTHPQWIECLKSLVEQK